MVLPSLIRVTLLGSHECCVGKSVRCGGHLICAYLEFLERQMTNYLKMQKNETRPLKYHSCPPFCFWLEGAQIWFPYLL